MNTNANMIFQRLQNVEDEISKLSNILFALKTTDLQNYGANYEELSTDAALRAERITCQLRNLIYISDCTNKSTYMKLAADAQGIHVMQENGILSITLPSLLPKRKVRTNTAFLHEPLNYALQEYLKNHNLTLYKDCVVCFSQIYDADLSLRRIRDYDNLEFKQILDTIAAYILLDDSGLFCDSYHTTELGKHDHTTVYIMEKAAFPEWVKSRKNRVKSISEIS